MSNPSRGATQLSLDYGQDGAMADSPPVDPTRNRDGHPTTPVWADPILNVRRDELWPQVVAPVRRLFGDRADLALARIRQIIDDLHAEREQRWRTRDERRLISPDWFARPDLIGYSLAPDRFAGSLGGVADQVDHLNQLGVNLVHLQSSENFPFQASLVELEDLAETLSGHRILLAVQTDPLSVIDTAEPTSLARALTLLGVLANTGVAAIQLFGTASDTESPATGSADFVADAVLALRAALRIAAPGTLLIADSADPVMFGRGADYGRGCQLGYLPELQQAIWTAFAEQKAPLAGMILDRVPAPGPDTAWLTAARTPNPVHWDIADDLAERAGGDGEGHRQFLADFYAGRLDYSFAAGAAVPAARSGATSVRLGTARRRGTAPATHGTLASLAGLEVAMAEGAEPGATALAIARIVAAQALVLSVAGVPLLQAGDELGLLNDRTHPSTDPSWLNRPAMDWELASRRFDGTSPQCRIFSALANLIQVRRRTPQFHATQASSIVDTGSDHTLGVLRSGRRGNLLVLANVSGRPYSIGLQSVPWFAPDALLRDLVSGHPEQRTVRMDPYQVRWIAEVPGEPTE